MSFEQDHTPTGIGEYVALRVLSRDVLGYAGVASNLGFSDYDILRLLGGHLGAEEVAPYDQHHERAEELFRDHLASILGIPTPAEFGQVETALKNLLPQQP